MKLIVPIGDLKSRAEAVGLTLRELATRAGVAPSNAYKAASGEADSRSSTLRKLLAALEQAERERRDQLIELHPLPDQVGSAA